MTDLAWVDGWQGPLAEARISVQDRGFLFGDGAYEMLRVYDGRLFLMQPHLDRLEASLRGLSISMPRPRRFLDSLLPRLVRESGHRQARVYVQVTRGTARREHVFPSGVRPSLVVWVEDVTPVPEDRRRNGIRAISIADPRWDRCHLKALVLLPNVLARQQALEKGAGEALLVGPHGMVREGAGTNVFVVRRGQLWTPPLSPEILPGVTRAHVMRLATKDGVRVVEKRFRLSTLLAADEVFVTSTTLEILPVVEVDAQRIAAGRPGPLTHRLVSLFRESTKQIA